MKPRSLPLRGPASCFTATGLTSSLHSWADKAESSFPSILALLAGCSLIPTSGRTQRGQPGKAGSGHCEPPLLCPSQVGRGLWPGAGWGGWGGWGGGPPPRRPPPSSASSLRRPEVAGRRRRPPLLPPCLFCFPPPLPPASAAPSPLLPAHCRLRSPLGCPVWPSGSLGWPPSPPSHSWACENLPEALLGRALTPEHLPYLL